MSSNSQERRPLLHRNPRSSCTLQSVPSSTSSSPSPPTNTTTTLFSYTRYQLRIRAGSVAILLSLIFERAAFYGLVANLVLFLNEDPLGWCSYNAMDALLFFFGVCFVMSLIGGWLADSVLGRFKTILIAFVVYFAGYVSLLTASHILKACQKNNTQSTAPEKKGCHSLPFNEYSAEIIFPVLIVIAIGAGIVKANIAPFGSDQVTREGQQATLSFFNWFYWSVNLGALLGLSLITYVEQQFNFCCGYLISVICLGLSTLLFVAEKPMESANSMAVITQRRK